MAGQRAVTGVKHSSGFSKDNQPRERTLSPRGIPLDTPAIRYNGPSCFDVAVALKQPVTPGQVVVRKFPAAMSDLSNNDEN